MSGSISMIVVPFCSLVPAVIIAHTIVGPIGWAIGDAIGNVVYAGLTSNVRFLFAAVFRSVVCSAGYDRTPSYDERHRLTAPGFSVKEHHSVADDRAVQYCTGLQRSCMSVLQKKNERAQQVNVPACISCYLGVTEPGALRCKPEICIPACMRHDRFLLRGNDLCGLRG